MERSRDGKPRANTVQVMLEQKPVGGGWNKVYKEAVMNGYSISKTIVLIWMISWVPIGLVGIRLYGSSGKRKHFKGVKRDILFEFKDVSHILSRERCVWIYMVGLPLASWAQVYKNLGGRWKQRFSDIIWDAPIESIEVIQSNPREMKDARSEIRDIRVLYTDGVLRLHGKEFRRYAVNILSSFLSDVVAMVVQIPVTTAGVMKDQSNQQI
ncbi:hypothetical protein Tco_0078626 [Tanacetum coccineum]